MSGLSVLSGSCRFTIDIHQVNVSSRRDSIIDVGDLSQDTTIQQKRTLKERVCMLITATRPQLAAEITVVLLESFSTAELLYLLESPLALDEKMKLVLGKLSRLSSV